MKAKEILDSVKIITDEYAAKNKMNMTKLKKAPTLHYGIEITKPHSKEMYAHNDKVAEGMKSNILKAWSDLIQQYGGTSDWSQILEDSKLAKLQKNVCYSGYGDGYTTGDVDTEFCNEVEMMANWQLHEVYAYCYFDKLVPKIKQGMVGFIEKDYIDYWTEPKNSVVHLERILDGIDGAKVGFVNRLCEDEYPYIKTRNYNVAEDVVQQLEINGISSEIDLYEDEDGDDDDGRPIIRKIWSVKLNTK